MTLLRSTLLLLALLLGGLASPALADPAGDKADETVIQSLSRLDGQKVQALFDHLGVKPAPDLYDCLCPGEYGFHYYNGPEGACRRIGPLGGTEFRNYDMGRMTSCSAAYPLADGRTVLEAIKAAIPPKAAAVCPAPNPNATLEEVQAAAPFTYAAWPMVFRDVRPENIIYELSAGERQALSRAGDEITAYGNRIKQQAFAALRDYGGSALDIAQVAARTGYNVAMTPKNDVRIDMELAEFAWTFNPKLGRYEVSEYVLKFPAFGEGRNLEVAVGLDGSQWDGKLKLGFSVEQNKVPLIGQIEGKVGFEYDTRTVMTTSLEDEPPPAPSGRLDKLWTGLQSYLAGVDFYFGTAVGPGPDIGAHHIAVGPETTWSIKQAYSDALFQDMFEAMDAVLDQQKRLEDKRHAMIRGMAERMGVPNAQCLTIHDAIVGIQHKLVDEARAKGIPTEGRSIKDIRKDLATPASGNAR